MSRRPGGGALLLATLTLLFAARVGAQALVAFLGVAWLPPMERWYSGLVPYPVLLLLQLAVLALQTVITRDAWRGRGLLAGPLPRAGRWLRRLAVLYALAMLVRLAVTGSHVIPVAFHWVLAAYLVVLARLLAQPRPQTPASG